MTIVTVPDSAEIQFKLLALPDVYNGLSHLGIAAVYRSEHVRQYAMDCVAAYLAANPSLVPSGRKVAITLPNMPKPHAYASRRMGFPRSFTAEQMHKYATDAIGAHVEKLSLRLAA